MRRISLFFSNMSGWLCKRYFLIITTHLPSQTKNKGNEIKSRNFLTSQIKLLTTRSVCSITSHLLVFALLLITKLPRFEGKVFPLFCRRSRGNINNPFATARRIKRYKMKTSKRWNKFSSYLPPPIIYLFFFFFCAFHHFRCLVNIPEIKTQNHVWTRAFCCEAIRQIFVCLHRSDTKYNLRCFMASYHGFAITVVSK